MIVHVAIADAIDNDQKSIMILTLALFFLAPFSPLSRSLVSTGLFLALKEFWLS